MGALNSLGETMQIPPTEVFNKVLCKSDENEDVKKRMYNWWRAVFEVLSKCDIPDDRVDEYNEKVDDLMAEILKSGDGEATAEEEPEDVFAEEYEPASMKDEAKMLEDMDFAIQHIGEVANKVQALINFVNPYCGTEVNESGDQPKFKVGDVVKVMGVSGMDFYGRDAPIGPIVKIEPPHPDVGVYEYLIKGRSGEFFAYEDELELVPERFTEEENSKMKKITKERGCCGLEPDYDDLPDDWGSWNNYDGDEDDEGYDADSDDYELSDDERRESWRGRHPYLEKGKEGGDDMNGGPWLPEDEIIGMKVTGESDGEMSIDAEEFIEKMIDGSGATPLFDPYNGTVEKDGTVVLNVIAHREQVSYRDVANGLDEPASALGWKVKSFGYSDDVTSGMVDDGNVEIDVVFAPMQQVSENLENELKKGDDGWTTIGQPVSEAKVVVDANDVWDVLELLDNEIAHTELTDLINSHVRTEEEIMDAINELCGETISKKELNTLLSGRMVTLVDYLGLDVEQYENMGNFVDSDKPTSVELESTSEDEEQKNGDSKFKMGDYVSWGKFRGRIIKIYPCKPGNNQGYLVKCIHGRDNGIVHRLYDDELTLMRSSNQSLSEYGVLDVDELVELIEQVKMKRKRIKFEIADIKVESDDTVKVIICMKDSNKELFDIIAKDEIAYDAENWKVADVSDPVEDTDKPGMFQSEVTLKMEYDKQGEWKTTAKMAEGTDDQKPEEVKSQDKTFNQDGENKQLVAGEGDNKKPVCEMTVEQEIDDPWKLSEMLWSQGKENLEELLRSELVGEEDIMMMLEDMGLRNLTSINDAFAFDFPSILDSLGLDGEAWSQNLEFKRKGGED